VIGHNPSEHAWRSGFSYSNPSNRFFHLLRASSLVPADTRPCDANALPVTCGLGFADLGCEPGSDAAAFKRPQMLLWRSQLYQRLSAHLARVQAWSPHLPLEACAPQVVAFAGKRQWSALFQPPLARCAHGRQTVLPPGWPLPGSTEVWVLPSSSGRAVMTKQEREEPYVELGRRVADLPWPGVV
jgi:TDG/mug DNA glycosylase family protein